MSKSLKNFTTIRSALAKGDYTARSLRIIFLLGAWGGGIEITGKRFSGLRYMLRTDRLILFDDIPYLKLIVDS